MLLRHSAQYLAHSSCSIKGLGFSYIVADPGFLGPEAYEIWRISLSEKKNKRYKVMNTKFDTRMQMRSLKLILSSTVNPPVLISDVQTAGQVLLED